MSKTSKQILLIIVLICILALFIFLYINKGTTNKISEFKGNSDALEVSSTELEISYDSSDEDNSWDTANTTYINLSDSATNVNGEGVSVQDNIITINKAGTYYLKGQLSNGSIVIDTSKNDEVHLIFDGVSISSNETSAIYGKKAKKIIITLAENSTNYIEDASTRTQTEDNEDLNGAIYSKSDLSINGIGTLRVKANYEDGIVSKDGLKIVSGNIQVDSNADGIRGKDYVVIKDGNITVKSVTDGIKSNNDTDESLGYICIEGGNIQIESGEDGIQAETILQIENANINVTTAGGSTNSTKSNKQPEMKGKMKTNSQTEITQTAETDEKSQKAIKAGKEINIKSGNFSIDSIDDAIHSNGNITISGGTIQIKAGDDAIHADDRIKIAGGETTIDTCYEGIEASYIQIDDGKITLSASDDGINISSGKSEDSQEEFGPSAKANIDANLKLIINGGEIQVSAQGDGLDSNGSIYINGGYIMVNGSISNRNGSLDYDGECIVTGGTLIAVGSSGMLQTPGNNSTQYSISAIVNGTAGEKVTLTDSDGTEILTFTPSKNYQSIVISSDALKNESEYTLKTKNTSLATVTISDIVTSVENINKQKQMF